MTGIKIRVNEADLLRAGWPRDAVNALRGIIAVIGTSVSIGSVSDLETLILTTTSGNARDANTGAQMQALADELGQVKRNANAFQQAVSQRLDALEGQLHRAQEIPTRVDAIERAIRTNNLQQQINELRDFTFGAR
jgi:endonuclease III